MKIPESYNDSKGVSTLTVSTRLKDISISIPIYMKYEVFRLVSNTKKLAFILFTKLLKLAPLRPGLVRLSIFLAHIEAEELQKWQATHFKACFECGRLTLKTNLYCLPK